MNDDWHLRADLRCWHSSAKDWGNAPRPMPEDDAVPPIVEAL